METRNLFSTILCLNAKFNRENGVIPSTDEKVRGERLLGWPQTPATCHRHFLFVSFSLEDGTRCKEGSWFLSPWDSLVGF